MENYAMIEVFNSFKLTSEVLYDLAGVDSIGAPTNTIYVPAYVVNSCFCIEIGFKYLIQQQGGNARGHDLVLLHGQLTQDNKDKIDSYIKSFSQDPSKYPQWFHDELAEVSAGFVDWRYLYEPVNTPTPGTSVVNTVIANLNFIKRLREALDNIINPSH